MHKSNSYYAPLFDRLMSYFKARPIVQLLRGFEEIQNDI